MVDIKRALVDAWEIVVDGVAQEEKNPLKKEKEHPKWTIDRRTKIRSLIEGLRQFENPSDSVTHFVKYAEYTLPRSDFNRTLEVILKKINEMRDKIKDPKELQEQIKYTIGYLCWSLDGLCNVLTVAEKSNLDESNVKKELDSMLSKVEVYLDKLMKWYKKSGVI